MNWFDIFIVIILIRTGYIGLKNGFSAEIYKYASFGISTFGAVYLYKRIGNIIIQYNTNSIVSDAQLNGVIFLLILFAGMLAFRVVFIFVHNVIKLSFAKNFDTTAGIIFGLLRGLLVSCLIFVVLNWTTTDYIKESVQKNSFSGPYIEQIGRQLKTILIKLLP